MKLTIVMEDRWRTECAIVHENEHVPYGRRTVHIELTPEQLKQIEPRYLGNRGLTKIYEHHGQCWLEADEEGA